MDDYTLIVPTYQRPVLLRAQLEHLAKFPSGLRVLVLDSSGEAVLALNRATLAEFSFVRHQVYDQATRFVDKLQSGLREVATPFVSLCADDDILFPTALEHCVEVLRRQPEVAAAHGTYLNFTPESTPSGELRIECECDSPTNGFPAPATRLFYLLQRYEALYYAVYRTPLLREIFALQAQIETLHYQELFQAVATVLHGAVWRLPDIYCARRASAPADAKRNRWEPGYWVLEDDYQAFLEHYLRYRQLVLNWWRAREPGLEPAQMERLCDGAHYLYVSKALQPWNVGRAAGKIIGSEPPIPPDLSTGVLRERLHTFRKNQPPAPESPGRRLGQALVNGLEYIMRRPPTPTDNRLEFSEDGIPVTFGTSLPNPKLDPDLVAAAKALRRHLLQEMKIAGQLRPA